jgi:hypothetical protein
MLEHHADTTSAEPIATSTSDVRFDFTSDIQKEIKKAHSVLIDSLPATQTIVELPFKDHDKLGIIDEYLTLISTAAVPISIPTQVIKEVLKLLVSLDVSHAPLYNRLTKLPPDNFQQIDFGEDYYVEVEPFDWEEARRFHQEILKVRECRHHQDSQR